MEVAGKRHYECALAALEARERENLLLWLFQILPSTTYQVAMAPETQRGFAALAPCLLLVKVNNSWLLTKLLRALRSAELLSTLLAQLFPRWLLCTFPTPKRTRKCFGM